MIYLPGVGTQDQIKSTLVKNLEFQAMENASEDAHLPPRLRIEPPLLNSANPWATTLEQLRDLYRCAATGAVTTRTALLDRGFPHDDNLHRFRFFDVASHRAVEGEEEVGNVNASLNTLGYSPIPLDEYLLFIGQILDEERQQTWGARGARNNKPFIVSVTGSPDEVAECYYRVAACASALVDDNKVRRGEGKEVEVEKAPLALEINLSCPNIPGKPPPAYDGHALRAYIRRVAEAMADERICRIPWGLKTPPYTHAGQFEMFVGALRDYDYEYELDQGGGSSRRRVCPVSFVTATNTLGSCLLVEGAGAGHDLAGIGMGIGIGGMAGAPLHPLALGNVATLRRMLDEAPDTRHVEVLGVGGVGDAAGYERMRRVGAAAVGVGTALGVKGLRVFEDIRIGLGGGSGVR